jgi:hypothetical protein
MPKAHSGRYVPADLGVDGGPDRSNGLDVGHQRPV